MVKMMQCRVYLNSQARVMYQVLANETPFLKLRPGVHRLYTKYVHTTIELHSPVRHRSKYEVMGNNLFWG